MGPKAKFTREDIIEAAFDIAQEEGLDKITMRKVAVRMGGSVAPIYVNFKDISELKEALIERIIGLSQQLLMEESTGSPFYDIGKASLRFAREYSVLFRDLIFNSSQYMQTYNQKEMPVLIAEMKKDPNLKGFTTDELKMILLKMRIFQLGLSVMIANGLMPDEYEPQNYMDLLSSAADDVIRSTRLIKGN